MNPRVEFTLLQILLIYVDHFKFLLMITPRYRFSCTCSKTSKFLGVQSLTLHLGVQRKLTAFSPCKVVHHAVFVNITQSWQKLFFSVWHWVRQEVGFCLTRGLCVESGSFRPDDLFQMKKPVGMLSLRWRYRFICSHYRWIWLPWAIRSLCGQCCVLMPPNATLCLFTEVEIHWLHTTFSTIIFWNMCRKICILVLSSVKT
jgi:hypothetical protein